MVLEQYIKVRTVHQGWCSATGCVDAYNLFLDIDSDSCMVFINQNMERYEIYVNVSKS